MKAAPNKARRAQYAMALDPMKTITLPGTTITTTSLGFGCNALLGPHTRQQSLKLLGTAFDAGIRHFDVARAYGYGEAERLVGEFLQTKRDEVTITTKFGMQPMKSVARMRGIIALGRRLMRLSPSLRKLFGRQAASMIKGAAFSVEDARRSLETSLRELKTDYIDLFLLHECQLEDCSPALLDFLNEAKRQGVIKDFGVGTQFVRARAISLAAPGFARVLQFENSVLTQNIGELPTNLGKAVIITHHALSSDYTFLRRYLETHPEIVKRWSQTLDIECEDEKNLSRLMLNYAMYDNKEGIVLFSSTKAENIQHNVRAVTESPFSAEQLQIFAELVRRDVIESSLRVRDAAAYISLM
jgi:D-threo-aldose 1-dehydrogenase